MKRYQVKRYCHPYTMFKKKKKLLKDTEVTLQDNINV